MSLLGCIGIGIWYWLTTSDYGKCLMVATDTYWMGLIIGLFCGNPAKGFQVAATIELAFMGVVAVGGTLPSDKKLAALIAIPLTLKLNLDLGTALAVAIPFGMLGSVINNTGYVINTVTHEFMVKCVEKHKYNQMYFWAYGAPGLIKLPMSVIPVAAILYLTCHGTNAEVVLNFIPVWLNRSLTILGQILPAVGIISCVRVVGSKKLVPWFILGYFICVILPDMSTLMFAVVACLVAVIIVSNMSEDAISGAHKVKDNK
ncbi:PTS sugar transporter subunit IIC [Floccifex sp.]|uniref:PTS sugar transporter subunit IIC n=1 Tax=Floccifex sp. TaxID=2815810 RepID=UPI003F00B76E